MEKGIEIGTSTLKEVKEFFKFKIALLPWGAIEPHNYHLPYMTDCILAEEIAKHTSRLCKESGYNIGVLPPIYLGSQNPGQLNYNYCMHFSTETQKLVLLDIVKSLRYQGINKLIIINGHMGNCFKSIVRDLTLEFQDFQIFVVDWLNIPGKESIFENQEDHAGEIETSAMLYYRPELVHLADAGPGNCKKFNIDALNRDIAWTPRDWSKISVDSGTADPSKATVDKGKAYCDLVCKEIKSLILDLIHKPIYANKN